MIFYLKTMMNFQVFDIGNEEKVDKRVFLEFPRMLAFLYAFGKFSSFLHDRKNSNFPIPNLGIMMHASRKAGNGKDPLKII